MSGGGADLEFGIWSIRIDGSNRRKLADTFTHCGPDLSPDGQSIAYENMVNGSPQLFIMRPDVVICNKLPYMGVSALSGSHLLKSRGKNNLGRINHHQ
jgi:hypothetical protein